MYSEIIQFIRKLFNSDEFIPLHEPKFIGNEKKYLLDVIDSTFVSTVGKYVERFEDMICNITGAKYTVATINGTAALHISLILAGVKSGEEVLTQSLTFVATANSISYINASPVFLDVDKNTLGLSPEAVDSFLKENTQIKNGNCYNMHTQRRIAACVPMHTFGHPCRIDKIVEICNKYHIPIVEDAAESIGSLYKGRHTGLFGDLGIISFNGNKTVTCGGGGAIITNNEILAKRAKHITTTSKISHPYRYIHDEVGYNYRLPNLNAALGCAQLEQIDNFILEKRELAKKYETFFQPLDIHFVKEPANARSNYWLNTILLPDHIEMDEFLEFTNNSGVMTRPCWHVMNKLDMYMSCQTGSLENTQWLENRIVNIPSGVGILGNIA